jgi:DDE superfamily endonuclease
VKNVLLINAALTILFLSETDAGSTHDKRIAEATPYPLPAGSRLLQDLGFRAFTLDQAEILMPTRKPRGRALPRAQKAANRRIARRCVRIEHVNRSVKRCRIVHDTSRLRKTGVRGREIPALASSTTSVPARATAHYNTERTRPPSTKMVVPVI